MQPRPTDPQHQSTPEFGSDPSLPPHKGQPSASHGGPKGKQLEREQREAEWLRLALGILLEEGYLGLTMDRLAKATGYAKGTLYLHFKNKEDLICALLRDFQVKRMELFDRVADLDLPHRARLAAIGLAAELFPLAYPENARIEPVLKTQSLRDKASPERLRALEEIDLFCFSRVLQTVQAAVDAGELRMQAHETPEQLVMALWSMHVGLNVLRNTTAHLTDTCSTTDSPPHEVLFPIAQRLLDGYGWQPLSTEFDYAGLRQQLLREPLSAEAERAWQASGIRLL